MRASENTVAGVSLFVLLMIAGGAAAAMEQNGSVTASSPPPAWKLPAFLDAERLPVLQEAWRATETDTEVAAPATPQAEQDPMSAARAAIKRLGDATRQAPAVRQAAEELSRRFSVISGPSSEAGVVVTTTVGEKPAAEASRQDAEEAAAVAADGAAPLHVAAPVTATSAIPEAEMRPQSAHLDPIPPLDMSPGTVAETPPLPVRAPEATAPPKTKTKAKTAKSKAKPTKTASTAEKKPAQKSTSTPPIEPSSMTAEPPPAADASVVAGRREVFPPYMRAFGWDDQP